MYTTLVGLLNARNYNFGGEFVEAMIRQLKETLKSNLYTEAFYLVCVFLHLVCVYIFTTYFKILNLSSGAFPKRPGKLSRHCGSLNGCYV